MFTLYGGKERTLEQFVALGDATGWRLEAAKSGIPSTFMFAPA